MFWLTYERRPQLFHWPVNIGLLSVFLRFRGSISDIGFNFESHELWMIVRNYQINGKGCCSYYTLLISFASVAYRVAKKGIFPSMPERHFARVRDRLLRWFQRLT
jgi:hypothetical protein